MKMISRVFRYLRYFLQAETKELRTEAFLAAKKYYAGKEKTSLEFQYFQRGYKNYICDKVARERLAQTSN
jgi:hypothetical protein